VSARHPPRALSSRIPSFPRVRQNPPIGTHSCTAPLAFWIVFTPIKSMMPSSFQPNPPRFFFSTSGPWTVRTDVCPHDVSCSCNFFFFEVRPDFPRVLLQAGLPLHVFFSQRQTNQAAFHSLLVTSFLWPRNRFALLPVT